MIGMPMFRVLFPKILAMLIWIFYVTFIMLEGYHTLGDHNVLYWSDQPSQLAKNNDPLWKK